jgi:hypothetical protein
MCIEATLLARDRIDDRGLDVRRREARQPEGRERVVIERVAAAKLPTNKVQGASSCSAICAPIRAASTLRLRSDRVRARSPLYLFLMSNLQAIVAGLWSWIGW